MLFAENHTTGAIQVVTHMINCARYWFSSIDVPVVGIGFGHPNCGANLNTVDVFAETVCFINVKHCDISIVKIHITSSRQRNVGR